MSEPGTETWLLLIFDVNSRSNDKKDKQREWRLRTAVARALAKNNVVKIQQSVYGLPESPGNRLILENLKKELKSSGAYVFLSSALCGREEILDLASLGFDERYARLIEDLRDFKEKIDKAVKMKKSSSWGRFSQSYDLLANRYEDIVRFDKRDPIPNKQTLVYAELGEVRVKIDILNKV